MVDRRSVYFAVGISAAILLGSVAGSFAGERLDITWSFEGCEADDVRTLTALGSDSWLGDSHTIGPLRLQHSALLACDRDACTALLSMEVDRRPAPAAAMTIVQAPLTLTLNGRHQGHEVRIDGAQASALRRELGPAAFIEDGRLSRVLLDHGRLAGQVWIRVRTVVGCATEAPRCAITSDPVVYVPYEDRFACGDLAAAAPGS